MAAEKSYYDDHLVNFSSNTGYPTIFINGKNTLLHRYVWEKHYGKIPEGFQIHHKDKNRHNYSIENLELIERSDHSRHHALENGLGKCNKGKLKHYASGFCNGATPVYLVKDGGHLYFESVTAAAKFLETRTGNISRVLKRKRKTVKGWCCHYA